jgi:hypothetical protein
LILLFVLADLVVGVVVWFAAQGVDLSGPDPFGPCSIRMTDHWGWLASRAPSGAKTLRVLFVGDSLTYSNSLPGMLVRVASSDPVTPVALEVRSITAPDASLSRLWDEGCGRRRLASDHYDIAILQEHSFFWAPDAAEQAREAAGRWIPAVRSFGARPIFFEPWVNPPDAGPQLSNVDDLKSATAATAGLYGAEVARVGEAFAEATTTSGAPDLYVSDRHHPSRAGTWLASLVIFHMLTGEAVEHSTWRPAGISANQASILTAIADRYG